jgi:hypothetical protein
MMKMSQLPVRCESNTSQAQQVEHERRGAESARDRVTVLGLGPIHHLAVGRHVVSSTVWSPAGRSANTTISEGPTDPSGAPATTP